MPLENLLGAAVRGAPPQRNEEALVAQSGDTRQGALVSSSSSSMKVKAGMPANVG